MTGRLHSRLVRLAPLLFALISGCSSLRPQDFGAGVPVFEPETFFDGPVVSWGVIETRSWSPRQRVTATLSGRREGADLILQQTLLFDDGRKVARLWRIHRVNAHRYEATADGVTGTSAGYAYGNTFHWVYSLEMQPGNRLSRVRMEHWMYLVGQGDVMINRVAIRKFGVLVAQTTECFQKVRDPVRH